MSDLSSRTVVSMPSLDAVDEDVPVSTEEVSGATLSDTGLTTETSFASTLSTAESVEESEPSESFSSAAEAFTTNTETYTTTTNVLTTEESFTLSETASVDPNQLLESSEETEQEQEQTSEDVEPVAEATVESQEQNVAEESEAMLQHQVDPIDEQAEDDPSIAIDQFIKKIADEQLSSKRRELEESSEEEQVDAVEETNQLADETSQLAEYHAQPNDNSLEATLTGNDSEDLETHQQDDVETRQQEVGDQMAHDETSMEVETSTHAELETQPLLETAGESEPERTINVSVESQQRMQTDHAAEEPEEQPPEPPYPEQDPALQAIKIEKETLPDVMLDSSEVSRDPFLIALAQEEIRKLDVLVCGGCHLTFYMIEDFQNHKNGRCTDVSSVLPYCESEGKPQVWGFSLWKVRYLRECGDKPPRPWLLYQKWCKLPQQEKNAWITAGQSIQYVSKIGNAKVASLKKRTQSIGKETHPIEFVDSNKENSDVYDSNIAKKAISKPVRLNNDVTILPSNKSSRPTNSNVAVRTTKNSSQRNEYAVEKILAKRFNPRRKTWEYQIKWENFDSDANTWEPITNLSHCKQMLEQFEEQLKRVKEEKARQAALAAKGRGRPATATKPPLPQTSDFTPGRPPRSSKQKAIDHLKTWVSQGSDDEGSQGKKRGRDYDDDDEDYEEFEKKIKLEQESEDDEDHVKNKTKVVVTRKVTSTPGVGKQGQRSVNIKSSIVGGKNKEEILPSNILIPDANGVVRINQKQLPALSSGVYIMSKTAGIIKLDSTTSKVATSGGQTIVKVAPKIGQTQIKIVKKDGNTTKQIVQVQSTSQKSPDISSNKPTLKTYQGGHKIVPKLKGAKPNPPKSSPEVVRVDTRKPQTPPQQEDSDDGLEPLEFPDEIVVPEPEPENSDFELDPETGKIKGMEYVDKPVVIKEEPGTRPRSTNELENIVKIAAAGITDDDLTNGNDSQDEDPLDISHHKGYKLFMNKTSNVQAAKKPEGSLLNKALTVNTQRTPSGLTYQQQRPQVKTVTQRVINQQVSQRPQGGGGITTRIVTQSSRPGQPAPIIRKVMTPTPKYRVSSQQQQKTTVGTSGSRVMSQQGSSFQMRRATDPSKMQVYSTKSSPGAPVGQVGQAIIRKVGYGMQRSTTSPQIVQRTVQQRAPLSPQKPPQNRVMHQQQPQRYYPSAVKREHQQPQIVTGRQVAAKPKSSINMPSLIGEEDLPATPKLAAKPQPKPAPAAPPVAVVAVEEPKAEEAETADVATADLSTFTMADSDNPIYITGDDGTVYQVAGQNEQGQTILITQGPDGQQQCLLVTNEVAEGDEAAAAAEAEAQSAEATAVVAEGTEQHVDADALAAAVAASEESMMIPLDSEGTTEAMNEMQLQTPLQIKTDMDIEETQLEDGSQDQVVAQVVRAEPPSPGGTHKVVVMLPDGNLMVTQVSPEEYRSLELE